MKEYKVMNNYLIFKELGSDSLGTNYRAGEIEDNRAARHKLVTVVHPFLSQKSDVWKRVKILLEGVKKSNIPNLYSPQEIEVQEDHTLLVYPLLKGKTFEQILEDSTKKSTPINFDLAFSIAIVIADIIDTGASIVVSGKKSFHGFLTPDNIIIDYDGKIFLKNYGIYPYLKPDAGIFLELEKKYGTWLAPEFLRQEKLVPQSDIYHLGYIIYRMLTGNYFSYEPGEDFDAKFATISFSQHIPSADKDFLTNIITLFKRTLHPEPLKRFANIREFKDYISSNFKIEELSSVTFSLAYFMNSLYLETMADENKDMENESAYIIPVKEEKEEGALVEEILTGLEEKEKTKSKFLLLSIIIAVVAVAVAVVFYLYLSQTRKTEQERVSKAKQQQEEDFRAQLKILEQKYQQQIKAIEDKITTTEAEKKTQQEELQKIQKEWQQQKKQEMERLEKLDEKRKKEEAEQKIEEEKRKKEEEQKQKALAEEKEKKLEEEKKKLEAEKDKPKPGQLIPLSEAAVKPEQISGKNPGSSYLLMKKYAGREITVLSSILVDENGNVETIRILGDVPNDIKSDIKKNVKTWKFKPAQKDNINVKVWIQKKFSFKFKQ